MLITPHLCLKTSMQISHKSWSSYSFTGPSRLFRIGIWNSEFDWNSESNLNLIFQAHLLFLLFAEQFHSYTHLSTGRERVFPASRLVSKLEVLPLFHLFHILQGLLPRFVFDQYSCLNTWNVYNVPSHAGCMEETCTSTHTRTHLHRVEKEANTALAV